MNYIWSSQQLIAKFNTVNINRFFQGELTKEDAHIIYWIIMKMINKYWFDLKLLQLLFHIYSFIPRGFIQAAFWIAFVTNRFQWSLKTEIEKLMQKLHGDGWGREEWGGSGYQWLKYNIVARRRFWTLLNISAVFSRNK